jgi:hypothetical protein
VRDTTHAGKGQTHCRDAVPLATRLRSSLTLAMRLGMFASGPARTRSGEQCYGAKVGTSSFKSFSESNSSTGLGAGRGGGAETRAIS